MQTVRLTVGQALVKFLDNQYLCCDGQEYKFVRGVFTIFGHGNVLGIGQALESMEHNLVVHQARNEQGMGHAATGYAKQMLRRSIYVCTSSIGPGAANMVTAAATATANRIPVLFLPGDAYAVRQPDPVLQQIEQFHDLSISTNDAFRAVSRYWDRVNRPEQLMSAMLNAIRTLADPELCGAVTVSLPQDVQGEVYDWPVSFLAKRVHWLPRPAPDEQLLLMAVEMIRNKRKPLIICGGGVKYSGAGQELAALAEQCNIPIAETQAGKSAVLSDHPLNLGGIGTTGNLAANTIAAEADLVIGIGTRYTDFTTASKSLFANPDVQFLNINIGRFDGVKMDGLALTADARTAIVALKKRLVDCCYISAYSNEITIANKQWQAELERLYDACCEQQGFVPEVAGQLDHKLVEYSQTLHSGLTQTRAIGIINKLLGDRDVIVGSSGSLPGDLQRMWLSKGLNTYHIEYGYSCMGYEVNAALGVKIAAGDNCEVYSMVGDGSFLMAHSELITALQEGRKINVLLFDNVGFGCINNLQMGNGMDSFMTEFRCRNQQTGQLDGTLMAIDYAACAAGYGCKTYSVHSGEQLREALLDSKRQTICTLLDIKVLPKTMTKGYAGWWRVGLAETGASAGGQAAYAEQAEVLKKIRKY